MNKIICALLVLFIVMPIAYADGLNIDRIRAYVENERDSNADEEGGNIAAAPGDNLEFVIDIKNEDDSRKVRVYLEGKFYDIDDGDDIVKDQDWFDIEKENEESKTLSFNIPSGARNDDYDFDLYVEWDWENGTTNHTTIEYIIEIDDAGIGSINLESSFDNLTQTCGVIANGLNSCFGIIANNTQCQSELSTVKEERGTFQSNYNNCNEILQTKNGEISSLEREKTNLENKMSNMIELTEHEKIKASAVKEAENAKDQFMMIVGGLGLVGFMVYNNKKKKSTVQDTYYYEKK